MAVRPCSVQIDIRQHEIKNHGTPMFPCGGYQNSVGDNITECIPWHWHEEVEVIAGAEGILRLDVPNQTILLKKGEAVFINASVLHTAVNADNGICRIQSLVFAPQLIFGALESVLEQKYVRPLISAPGLSVIHLKKDLPWHRDAIHCIQEAFACYQKEAFGYELLVRDALSRMWFCIAANQRNELEQHQNTGDAASLRVKEMLGYIHTHYAGGVTLKKIADASAVSERECLRCFKKVLGTTPMKYLLNVRISAAAGLLVNSDLNITEICKQTGFESPSYFALKFKAVTDMTPREYRQQGRRANYI